MAIDIKLSQHNIPISVSCTIEKKTHFDQNDVLNIENLIKGYSQSFITFDNKKESRFSSRIKKIKDLKDNNR